MMAMFKADHRIIPLVNLILVAFFCQLLLFLGGSVFLCGFKLEDEFLDMSGVDAKFYRCRSDGEFILDDSHEA